MNKIYAPFNYDYSALIVTNPRENDHRKGAQKNSNKVRQRKVIQHGKAKHSFTGKAVTSHAGMVLVSHALDYFFIRQDLKYHITVLASFLLLIDLFSVSA